MSFLPGKRANRGYNISDVKFGDTTEGGKFGDDISHYTDDVIYIGDMYNASVTAFKAFLDDIQYDVNKEDDLDDKEETGVAIYNSYSGTIGIKLSFQVPSHSRNEARNNLAKITHLQRSILQPRNDSDGTAFYSERNRSIQLVYFKNLINNGNLKGSRNPNNFKQLRGIGLPCNITEVTYTPDFSAGFHERQGEIFPKNYKVNLTLDPVTSIRTGGRYFFHPFNDNGHYSNLDSVGFPFLLKVGEGNAEAKDIQGEHGSTGWSTMRSKDAIKSELAGKAYGKSQTIIYIALPHWKGEKVATDISTGKDLINRFVVFKPFLDSFTRSFKKDVVFQQDQGAPFNQVMQSKPNNKAVEYSFSFEVPSKNLAEAKRNCMKVQYLMRMFYTRQRYSREKVTSKDAASVKVYVHSFIEKANDAKKVATNDKAAYDRAARLQFKDLNINIDPSVGFHRETILMKKRDKNGKVILDKNGDPEMTYSHSNLYPKGFKVTIDLVDTNKFNYVKQRSGGRGEKVEKDRSFNTAGEKYYLFPSKTKYWRTS